MAKLTAKQAKFVEEYLKDLNATQAAIRAGYSKKTANAAAGRLLVNVSVKKAIQEAQKKLSEEALVTQADVIRGLLKEAEYMDDGTSHSARVSAWEKLGKHLGMFVERHDHTSKGDKIEFIDFTGGKSENGP
jgi:phage terminase small subunit